MESWKLSVVIIALVCLMLLPPAAAWHAVMHKDGPDVECSTCDYYTYTITANSDQWSEYKIEVIDVLPVGLSYDSVHTSPAPTSISYNTPTPGRTKLVWDFMNVPAYTTETITLSVIPTAGLTSISNMVTSRVKKSSTAGWEGTGTEGYSNTVTTRFSEEVCEHQELPEFPSIAVPVAMIIGVIFIIYTLRTREE
jgi:hypothetical protein